MAPGLLHGAYDCIKHHASPELKAQYLQKVATGEWLATMCLTEPHAGSDLGLARTKAMPQANGSYAISGTKIFISGGEHDLTDNIVHLVLARLPDSPPGPKGLSLFLVPKFYADGQRSAAVCERIEEKMGLHGSPTCVMRFDDATGWLVGEVGKGLNAMFLMMNAARLHVVLQGIGLLDAAWQKADAYARERLQMRAPGPRDASQPADPIIRHPAVQRLLDTQRAWVDAGRVIAYATALELDMAKHHPDAARRQQAQRWCALATPVLKASWTDQGFLGASDCLQVLGGHGYVREWGVEQIVRDVRVAMIYEGTNEIQAQDLLFRKVLPDGTAAFTGWLDQLLADMPDTPAGDHARQDLQALRELGRSMASAAPEPLYPVAGDFLRCVTLALMAWAWALLDARGPARLTLGQQAFVKWVRPEFAMRMGMVHQAM
jgi:alkylation response protein AidB-like acyl-CoA dehydrogenase